MKYSTAILGVLALLLSEVVAFPMALFDMMARAEDSATLEKTAAAIAALKEKRFVPPIPGFDPATQYVSNQGAHAFVPPNFAAGGQRGPCPGMFFIGKTSRHCRLTTNSYSTLVKVVWVCLNHGAESRTSIILRRM
jgi:hypothetical protein